MSPQAAMSRTEASSAAVTRQDLAPGLNGANATDTANQRGSPGAMAVMRNANAHDVETPVSFDIAHSTLRIEGAAARRGRAAALLVDGGGDDQRHAQRERADQHRERGVVVVDDLLPQLVGRELVDRDERR